MFMARVYTEIIDLYIENKDVYYTSGWVNAEYYRRNCKNGDKIKAVSLRYYDIVLGKRALEGVEELKIDKQKAKKEYEEMEQLRYNRKMKKLQDIKRKQINHLTKVGV